MYPVRPEADSKEPAVLCDKDSSIEVSLCWDDAYNDPVCAWHYDEVVDNDDAVVLVASEHGDVVPLLSEFEVDMPDLMDVDVDDDDDNCPSLQVD